MTSEEIEEAAVLFAKDVIERNLLFDPVVEVQDVEFAIVDSEGCWAILNAYSEIRTHLWAKGGNENYPQSLPDELAKVLIRVYEFLGKPLSPIEVERLERIAKTGNRTHIVMYEPSRLRV